MRKCEELGRKRKVGSEESEISTTSSVQLKTRRLAMVVTPEYSENSTCESASSDQVWASCCSSDLAKKNSKILDLKEEEVEENEVSGEFSPTTAGESVDSRNNRREETTQSSEVQAESGEFESTVKPKHVMNFRCPSEAELEEFFVTAEMNIQKQFTDKYNYDIVKDEPLEGRYEWVRI